MNFARHLVLLAGAALVSATAAQAQSTQDQSTQGQSAQGQCTLPVATLPSQVRVVVLLDTSGSMEGRGDGRAKIFGPMRERLKELLDNTKTAGSVELTTFDAGPKERARFDWPQNRAAAARTLNAFQANGANTYLYRSMTSVFARLPRRPDAATTAYVITDGQNNDPDRGYTITTALNAFEKSRGPFDKLYYIALGATIPQNVKARFAGLSFARAVEVPVGSAPNLNALTYAPALVDVDAAGRFPLAAPRGAALKLDTSGVRGGPVALGAAPGRLELKGKVQAGSEALLCVQTSRLRQNVLLRFPGAAGVGGVGGVGQILPPILKPPVLLALLNPQDNRPLRPDEQLTFRYRASAPLTVQLGDAEESVRVALPDNSPQLTLKKGQVVPVSVTNLTLPPGAKSLPSLQLGDGTPVALPAIRGLGKAPLGWWVWALPGLLIALLLLALWLRRPRPARATFAPLALSVDHFRVHLHGDGDTKASNLMRGRRLDVGKLFRAPALSGLVLERYRPPRDKERDPESLRELTWRVTRLNAQPARVRLEHAGDLMTPGGTLSVNQRYALVEPPPEIVIAPRVEEPQAPPIDVLVTLSGPGVGGPNGRDERELPLGQADLGAIFGVPGLNGLSVRREPGVLRLLALPPELRLTHISRAWTAGEALPLSVMLALSAAGGDYLLLIQDKASLERFRRGVAR